MRRREQHLMRTQLEVTNDVASELAGPGDAIMKTLEAGLDCDVFLRGNVLTLEGGEREVATAETVVRELTELVSQGHEIAPGTIEAITGAIERHESPSRILEDVIWRHRSLKVAPKTVNQKRYVDAIRDSTITVGIGPAGTGKSFLAVAMAVAALQRREVNRIVLTRPAVEAGERLGFLPGDLMAKVDPYLRPLFDALYDMLEPERVNQHLERGAIEIAPLAFMRGRTLNDSFIILDEAQNTSPEQMKMFLTRLGFGSRAVVTGDVTQIDRPAGQSGLVSVREILDGIDGVAFAYLDAHDVVRHKIVQQIVEAYRKHDESEQAGRARAVPIGEIVLCPEVAVQQAPAGSDGLGAELDLLVAHGVLHLLGYDHDTEDHAASMRRREEAACGRSGARAT